MSGFGKVTLVGEYFNQTIVNVLWYRSSEWLPGQGNPFDDVLAFVQAVKAQVRGGMLAAQTSDYTLLRWEGVGYDDAFNIVTASPLVVSDGGAGGLDSSPSMGAAQSVTLGLRCGEQVQINGLLKSKRNRGYLSIGPVGEEYVDNYSHCTSAYHAALTALANDIKVAITVLAPAVTLTPVRIHEVWTKNPLNGRYGPPLLGRTFSDVLGYTLPRVASYRRSRRPEA